MKHIQKAVCELYSAEKASPNLMQTFSIYCMKKIIEKEVTEEIELNSQNSQITQVIFFESILDECINYMNKEAGLQKEFWHHLSGMDINLTKLDNLKDNINQTSENVEKKWDQLVLINPNCELSITMYTQFLQEIRNNSKKAKEVRSQMTTKKFDLLTEGIDLTMSNLAFEKRTAIIHICGNSESIGKVQKVNNGFQELFGHTKVEMIGHSINTILPTFFAKIHNELLGEFFQRGRKRIF